MKINIGGLSCNYAVKNATTSILENASPVVFPTMQTPRDLKELGEKCVQTAPQSISSVILVARYAMRIHTAARGFAFLVKKKEIGG